MIRRLLVPLRFALLVALLLEEPQKGACFQPQSSTRHRPSQLYATESSSSSPPSSSTATSTLTLPRDVKEAVRECRQATQEALQRRFSRMDVEFPVGTKFGVEKNSGGKGGRRRRQQSALSSDASSESAGDVGPTQAMLDQSDRELARLYVDMFQPVGGDNIAVVFVDDALADAAKQQWNGDPTASSRVLALNRRPGGDPSAAAAARKSKKKKIKAKGFAAKLAAEVDDDDDSDDSKATPIASTRSGPFQLPEGTEVALFVNPGPKELVVIEKICQQVGMGTLVVLLNARLSKVSNFGTPEATKLFTEDFEPVFSLAAAPQEAAPNCLLYRAFPGDWVLARKPKVGQPKTILTQPNKPTDEECQAAFDQLEITDMEKKMEGLVENVAGWFR